MDCLHLYPGTDEEWFSKDLQTALCGKKVVSGAIALNAPDKNSWYTFNEYFDDEGNIMLPGPYDQANCMYPEDRTEPWGEWCTGCEEAVRQLIQSGRYFLYELAETEL